MTPKLMQTTFKVVVSNFLHVFVFADVVTSYISEEKPLPPKTPLPDFSSSQTPVTSAGIYFSSPVSAILPPNERPKSPILHCKRSRSLFAEVESAMVASSKRVNLFTRGIARAPLAERTPTSLDRMWVVFLTPWIQFLTYLYFTPIHSRKKPGVKSAIGVSPLNRFSFTSLKSPKQDTSGQRPQHQMDKDCIENERPTSPVFDERDLEPEPIRETRQGESKRTKVESNLSSFFSKWQFNPLKRNSPTWKQFDFPILIIFVLPLLSNMSHLN